MCELLPLVGQVWNYTFNRPYVDLHIWGQVGFYTLCGFTLFKGQKCIQTYSPVKIARPSRLQEGEAPLAVLSKQACCAGCRRRPFPMQLPQKEKSTPSVKWPYILNQWSNFDALWDLESSSSLWHSLFYNWKGYLQPFGRGGAVGL